LAIEALEKGIELAPENKQGEIIEALQEAKSLKTGAAKVQEVDVTAGKEVEAELVVEGREMEVGDVLPEELNEFRKGPEVDIENMMRGFDEPATARVENTGAEEVRGPTEQVVEQITAADYYAQSKSFKEAGDTNKQIEALLSVIKADPKYIEAYRALIEAYAGLGEHKKVIHLNKIYENLVFEKNHREVTQIAEEKVIIVEAYFKSGDIVTAVRIAEEIVSANPKLLNVLSQEIRNQVNRTSDTSSPINSEVPVVPVAINVNDSVRIASSAINTLAIVNFAREINVRKDYVITQQASVSYQLQTGVGTTILSQAPPMLGPAASLMNSSIMKGSETQTKEDTNEKHNDRLRTGTEELGDTISFAGTDGKKSKSNPGEFGRQKDYRASAVGFVIRGVVAKLNNLTFKDRFSGLDPPSYAFTASIGLISASPILLAVALNFINSISNNIINLTSFVIRVVAQEPSSRD